MATSYFLGKPFRRIPLTCYTSKTLIPPVFKKIRQRFIIVLLAPTVIYSIYFKDFYSLPTLHILFLCFKTKLKKEFCRLFYVRKIHKFIRNPKIFCKVIKLLCKIHLFHFILLFNSFFLFFL